MTHNNNRFLAGLLAGVLSISLLAGCGAAPSTTPETDAIAEQKVIDFLYEEIGDDAVPLAANPVLGSLLTPVASGATTYGNQYTTIDASNASSGYVMVKYDASETRRIKVQVTKTGGTTYTYDLAPDGAYDVFPMSQSNGEYKISIFRNVEGTKYTQIFSQTINITLKDELTPFLYPNQYVDFTANSAVVAKGNELSQGKQSELEKLGAIYNYVVRNFTYDYDLAKTVGSGYLPVVDSVLQRQKGICFDYAAVMCAMLRSQGIPTQLVVGYTSTGEYHAWISAHISQVGWLNNVISFDGQSWKLMDPTYASTGQESQSVMDYINNPSNYSLKYCY